VDLSKKTAPTRRRRGQELEDALLEAAWEVLVTRGYGSFTIDAVAERAGTSRPVLYRRWHNREDLVLAAIRHGVTGGAMPVPDTGSLRGDVIALLSQANERHAASAAVAIVQLGTYFQETGTAPAGLRQHLLGDRTTSIETIMQRAVERGEIDPARLRPRITNLPLDLARHEILMTLRPVPMNTIIDIVDDIFLPLVT
jgi:AcrR family transcriptional regulator